MSFKDNLIDYIDSYVKFNIIYVLKDGTKIRRSPNIPYKLGAKNTPSQIKNAILSEKTNWNGDILKSDSELENWMNNNKTATGIDCSGFVYYTLNEASSGNVMEQFNNTSYAWGVSAGSLTSKNNGILKTTAKYMVPGCTIRTDNGDHILVIYDVIKNSNGIVTQIKYAHSNGSKGPHTAYITIGNENQDLDGSAQTWHDIAYSNSTAKSLYNYTILLNSLQ